MNQVSSPLRWAGSKRRLIPELYVRLPPDIHERHYVEPFLGGGSLFFALGPKEATLGDLNTALVITYQEIKHEVDQLIDILRDLELAHAPEFYAFVRRLFNRRLYFSSPLVAAWFLYLNATNFNGLYRENRAGEYNVPIGSRKKPPICNTKELRAASSALRDAQLLVGDFEEVCWRSPGVGAFFYFDPPYDPVSATSSFASYTGAGFSEADQRRLQRTFARLDSGGAKCMLSNSDTPLIQELYKGYRVERVNAPRSISATGDRSAAAEVIVRNY